ncbi:hypothetical protein MVEN_01279100 [Mycena venus]|uniref:Uncharacterized protein n=1 Tax=Mycena venus TaxID=2733690 RepID=A0A8H6Y0K6_9AGAR|nr:hypothetical protein MVEN_01279100 [Mycena venus]
MPWSRTSFLSLKISHILILSLPPPWCFTSKTHYCSISTDDQTLEKIAASATSSPRVRGHHAPRWRPHFCRGHTFNHGRLGRCVRHVIRRHHAVRGCTPPEPPRLGCDRQLSGTVRAFSVQGLVMQDDSAASFEHAGTVVGVCGREEEAGG